MTDLERSLRHVVDALQRRHVRFAVVGVLAGGVRVSPVFRGDADLAIVVGSDDEAEALISSLRLDGYEAFAAVVDVGLLATVNT